MFEKFCNLNNEDNQQSIKSEIKMETKQIEDIRKKSLQLVNLPKSGSHIAITTASLPNVVYIRSMESDDNAEYVKILNTINHYALNAKPLKNMPKAGDICITEFQNSGYYRALILNPINHDKIVLIYIDFGNIEEKRLSELKEVDAEIYNLKCYALAVHLKNVPEFIPIQNIKDLLCSYVECMDVDLKLMYDGIANNPNDVKVKIHDLTNNICLNDKILEMRQVNEPKDHEEPIYRNDIEQKLLPPGKNVEVFVLDNSLTQIGYISCILTKDMIPLQDLTVLLKEYAEKINGVYTPRENELCVVKYDDGEWCRAECLEVVGDENPAVSFIDYGNMSPVHMSYIRKYPKEFKCYPCCTNSCLIADLPEEIDKKLADRLQQLIPMNEKLIINEISSTIVGGDTNVIHLPEIIKQLKSEKLL